LEYPHTVPADFAMTVWYDTTAVFGDGVVVLRTGVVTVCVHVVLHGAAVCQWCCTNRMTHGGHHGSLNICYRFYKFERMPQGICGAPATFQRVMERTFGDINFLEVLVYLDNLIIFGKTLEEHEERLLKVLDHLKNEGLKLSLDKCQFGRTSATYVGHIVSQDGIAPDPLKIEAASAWPKPQTLSELRSFLGFCGYYRRFVKDYSKICRPLNERLQGSSSHSRLTKAGRSVHSQVHVKSSEPFGSRWTVECDSAFEEIKAKLTQTSVLAFADTQKPYVLHADASLDGLGGVLYQEHNDKLRPVAFISRSLSPSEKRYPAHKLEFLALKWAVVDKLHDYLYGVPFELEYPHTVPADFAMTVWYDTTAVFGDGDVVLRTVVLTIEPGTIITCGPTALPFSAKEASGRTKIPPTPTRGSLNILTQFLQILP
ncbi:hypothetical protein NFI96_006273, partial [Prochilodus magdalenae]